jgi:DUF4097 and DUF4098 domain-containing protein YvlB
MGSGDWDGALAFSSVNGDIKLELPEDLNSYVSISTVSGKISTEYPLIVNTGRFSPRHLDGTIGSGGRSLSLRTVNGNIELHRL